MTLQETSSAYTGAEDILELTSLEDALSFKLFRINALNERAGGHHFRDRFGLTLREWRVLGLVVAKGPTTMGDIKKILLMDQSLLSRTIKKMCVAGVLRNEVNAADKRRLILSATSEGLALHEKCIEFTRERNNAMAEGLTERERAEFTRLLDRMLTTNSESLTQLETGHD